MIKSASAVDIKSNIYRKNRNNNNLDHFKKINTFTKYNSRQKDFFTPKPYKTYNRFPINYNSINDNYLNFMKKDIITPLSRPSLYEKFNFKSPNYKHIDIYKTKMNKKTKWAIGTIARAPSWETLPKKQQFKNYYFPPEYNNKNPEKNKNSSLNTDFIRIKVPEMKKNNSTESFLKMKRGYSCFNETKIENQFIPNTPTLSVKNLSSKNYDIINFRLLNTTKNVGNKLMNKYTYFRKKNISSTFDLMHTFNVNFNKEYTKKFNENHKRFFKYNGIFTNMYDSSNKNGNITLPFDVKNVK